MSYSKFIARLVTQHRGLVWLAVVLMAAASIYILVTRLTLDTEVLNLLPGKFASVQGSRFTTMILHRPPADLRAGLPANDADRLEEFAPVLPNASAVNPGARVWPARPWRPEGVHDLQGLAVPPCSISNRKRLTKHRRPAAS